MCGINFIYDPSGKLDSAPILRMNERLGHRGPDHAGYHEIATRHGRMWMGATRLEIRDPGPQSHQPFVSADGSRCLLFNGEIYNYRELRVQLEKQGIEFGTDSDTELLCAWMGQYGVEGLEAVEGMYALVFHDSRKDRLIVARDRFGIKPLYRAAFAGGWMISSECSGILASGLVPREFDPAQIPHFLLFKYADRPATFFKGIAELEPRSYLMMERGELKEGKLKFAEAEVETPLPAGELLTRTEALLDRSIGQQLDADVPVGLFLSGGVDSTLLLAKIRELGHRHFPTFSIEIEGEQGDYARRAAQQYDAAYLPLGIGPQSLDDWGQYIAQLDQPIGDGAGYLTWQLSREAKKTVGVVLSGAGADELFAGYERHRAYRRMLSLGPLGTPILRALGPALAALPAWSADRRRQLKILSAAAGMERDELFAGFCSLRGFASYRDAVEMAMIETLDQALAFDRNNYLVSDVLKVSDHASMAHGLELRVPYLSDELLQLCQAAGGEQLMKQGPKWLLKTLLTRMGGSAFARRRKLGFGMPLGDWLTEGKLPDLSAVLLDEDHPLYQWISHAAIRELWDAHQRGKDNFGSELSSMLILQTWYDRHISSS